jgi:TonB family protein
MVKLRHHRFGLLLLVTAWWCTSVSLAAHEKDAPALLEHGEAKAFVIARPAPEYPVLAKINYLQGQVRLELTINSEGKVAAAHVLEGDALLAASCLEAVRHWRFEPLTTSVGPLGFVTTARFKFKLHGGGLVLQRNRAEEDFLRQVKPPEVIGAQKPAHADGVIHMRVLVNEQGDIVDTGTPPAGDDKFEAACQSLRKWRFRPARWGSLPVASFLELNVPVSTLSASQADIASDNQ